MAESSSRKPEGGAGSQAMLFNYEGSIAQFDGDDKSYSSTKWAQDVEDNAEVFGWTPQQKLIIARRSLCGTAGLWLKSEKVFKTYEELKNALQKEFPEGINSKEMHELMATRKKRKDESYYQYMLTMKELGKRAKFPDYVAIQYIIDGIEDLPVNKVILYGVTTYSAFKEKLAIYEKMKEDRKKEVRVESAVRKKGEASSFQRRCYNCGDKSHVSAQCPNGIKCFRCNEYGHIGTRCPLIGVGRGGVGGAKIDRNVPNTSVKQSAGPAQVRAVGRGAPTTSAKQRSAMFGTTMAEPMSTTNQCGCMRSQYHSSENVIETSITNEDSEVMQIVNKDIKCVKNAGKPVKTVIVAENHRSSALIDSGSDVNLISAELCAKVFNIEPANVSGLTLTGLGRAQVRSLGKITTTINIDGQCYNGVMFHIIPRDCMPYDLIIGHEFLKNVTLLMSEGCVTIFRDESEWYNQVNCITGELESLLEHVHNPLVKQEAYQCIEAYHPVQVKEAPLELKIVLKDDVPVTQRPRRLSYMEQGIVEKQVDEWLKDGIIRELLTQKIMMIFIDDIIIPADNEEIALQRLKQVLEVAAQYGLRINWKKAKLIQTEIEYLGHIIKDGEVRPTSEKTDAVVKFPEPKTSKQLQSFLGLTSYFRKYIEHYAVIAKPLSDLLKKEVDFVFDKEQREAFHTLKEKLSTGPVLKIFDTNLNTELHTDASSIAISAVLMQYHPDTGLHPVQYMSRKTNDAQRKYSSYELEALAIIEGIKKFRHYLYGKHFKLVTDCKAFQQTLMKKDLTAKVARWVLMLNDYDFEVEHRAGVKMRHADALSRNPYVATITSLRDQIKQAQDQDDGITAIKEVLKEKPYKDYIIDGDILYKGPGKLLVIPKLLEKEIIMRIHGNGHFSKRKMKELICQDYYIKDVDRKIEEFVISCIPCLLATRKEGKQEGFLNPIGKESIPLDTIHLDHVGPLTETRKQYNYILTMIDAFTKFLWLFPTKSTTSAETLNKLRTHQQIFGNPRRIITDRGTAFTSHEFEEYCKDENIQHVTITTGIPRGNGQVERVHRIIIPMLTKLCIENTGVWYKHVSRVQRALNSTFQRSINTTPYNLLIGTKMRCKEDIEIIELLQEETAKQYDDSREELRLKAKEQILAVQEENRKYFNRRRKESQKYKIGDLVAIKRVQFGKALKIKAKYLGPYRITRIHLNDRYDMEKVNSSTEGPNRTSSSADQMKRWPEGNKE